MTKPVSRRAFLRATSAAAVTLSAASYTRASGANSRLSVAIVGPGGRGNGLLSNFFAVNKEAKADLTAVCDLWTRNRERGVERVKKASGTEPRAFKRLEELLQVKDVDAVILATPDHAHAQQIVLSVQGGKHVYSEKPFANVLSEANAAIDACRKSDRVVTLGTQRRSDPRFITATELIKAGAVGPVVQVAQVHNAYSPYRWRRDNDVKQLREADTDWKAFLMGRQDRPFDPRQYLEFRLFHDFSTGIIDQWMTHQIDAVHMLTGATFPKSVVASGGTYVWKDHRENGDTVNVTLEYPQGFQAIYSTCLANASGNTGYVLGREGTLDFEYEWRLSSRVEKGKTATVKPVEPKPGLQGTMDTIHMQNWLECIHKNQKETNCTAEHGYQHAIACIMADISLHRGRRVTFDEKARTIQEG